jgi:hypothetical protein
LADIKRYGDEGHLVPGDYYLTREPMGPIGSGTERAVTLYIDGLGKTQRVAIARPGAWTPEEIAKLPTKQEAIAIHLAPGLERAEANRKAWDRQREKEPKPPPKPPPLDPPTRKFLDDSSPALDLSDW